MPNFAQVVEDIRALTEVEIFKPADQTELNRRRADYAEIQRKEAERIRKEREEEIKALGLTPEYQKVMELIPVVTELWNEYTDDQADWIGNYSDQNSSGAPTKLSFNIKVYGMEVPDWARDKLDKMNLWESYDQYYWQYMGDQLSAFVEGLEEDYDFIHKWYQEGRSGGWLVLEVSSIAPDDMDAVIEAFDKQDVTDEDWFSGQGIKDAYNILKNIKKDLEQRVRDYQSIANQVDKSKNAVEKYAESDEYWKDFFSNYVEEEPAEKVK